MKTYKQFVQEMAQNIGSPFSMIENIKSYSSNKFQSTKDTPSVDIGNDLKLHVIHDHNKIRNIVNDHKLGKTVYESNIRYNEPSDRLPFHTIEQVSVDRVKSTEKLPKGFATDFIYNHWNSQHRPLISSDMQYTTGRNMWSRLVEMAHKNKKHVTYVNEHGNKSVVTPLNKDKIFDEFYGKSDEHLKRTLVLSHSSL